MPDVWTYAPKDLKHALNNLGAPCGTKPRVLKDRDPAWTCQANGHPVSFDIYIHDISEFDPSASVFMLLLCALGGVFLGLLWGKHFWHNRGAITNYPHAE